MKKITLLVLLFGFFLAEDIKAQRPEADSLISIAEKLFERSEYRASLEFFEKALPLYIAAHDSLQWLEKSIVYGDALISSGYVEKALATFLSLDSIQIQGAPFESVTKVKRQVGYSYRLLEQYDNAEKYYITGMEMAREAADTSVMAYFHNNLGVITQKRGDYAGSHRHLTTAYNYFEAADNEIMMGNVLNSMFMNFMYLELYKAAEPYIRKNLKIQEKLQRLYNLDIAYHNMGWNHYKQGRIDSAIIYYQRSLELTRKLGNPYEITYTLNQIGHLYVAIGENETAYEYYVEALELNRQTKRPISIAGSLENVADMLLISGNDAEAEKLLREALRIYEEKKVPEGRINLLRKIATNIEDRSEADSLLNLAASIANEYEMHEDASQVRFSNAGLQMRAGEWRKSISLLRSVYTETNSRRHRINAAKRLSRSYFHIGSDSTFHFANAAFEMIDEARTEVAGLKFRGGLFENHSEYYKEAAGWYLALNDDAGKAFELIEAAKARVMMDELAAAYNNSSSRISEDNLIKKQLKIKAINKLYNELEKTIDEEQRETLKVQIRDAEFDYQAFLNVANLENPDVKREEHPEPLSLKEAQSLLDEHSAIVEYAFSGSRLITLFITKGSVQYEVTDSIAGISAREFLSNSSKDFISHISKIQPVDTIKAEASQLFNILFSDFLNLNTGLKNLLIVADGPVSFIPFEVLVKDGSYLTENYTIKYTPSVSSIPFIKEPHRVGSGLLALAGSGLDINIQDPTRSGNSYASLPSTLVEVESIASHFSDAQVFKNNGIKESELKDHDLRNYRFIHFATHGQIDFEDPHRSGLLISHQTEMDAFTDDDGFLNSLEISMLDIEADMVVLSACKTGIGRNMSGEGLLGLQRSFLIAGASAVVVSLWDIYDRSTSVFMNEFYSNMLLYEQEDFGLWDKSMNWLGFYSHPLFDYKARALRDAKKNMIEHPYYSHPVYWASFILIGK